jgi:predicted TIM-barrel fold metal-dependent hydrolase
MEVSGLPPKNLLKYFPDLNENANKVIFGSDWPGIRSIKDNIEAIRALALENSAKHKILGLNAARLLGLK